MKKAFAAVMVFGLCSAFLPQAQAQPFNKRTTITVHQAIQVPGAVLEPGKYVMRLHDIGSRNVVQFMNENEDALVTTVLTIPHYRATPTEKTEFRFWEIAEGQPKPLRAWFYPGEVMGREFIYPKGFANTIAKAGHMEVPAVDTEASTEVALGKAHLEMVNESGLEKPLNLTAYEHTELPKMEAGAVENTIEAKLETVAGQPSESPSAPWSEYNGLLPSTASVVPTAGVISAAILAAGVAIRRIAARM